MIGIKGLAEIILDCSDFTNLTLYRQANYQIQFSFTSTQSLQIIPSLQLTNSHFTCDNPLRQLLIQKDFPIGSTIQDDKFYSKVFYICQANQRLVLNDIVLFKVIFNAFPLKNEYIHLKIKLLWTTSQITNIKDLEVLAETQYKFSFLKFQNHNIQAVFQGGGLSMANIYIYSTLLNLKISKFEGEKDNPELIKMMERSYLRSESGYQNMFQQQYIHCLQQCLLKINDFLTKHYDKIPNILNDIGKIINNSIKIEINSLEEFIKENFNEIHQIAHLIFTQWQAFISDYHKIKPKFFQQLVQKTFFQQKLIYSMFVLEQPYLHSNKKQIANLFEDFRKQLNVQLSSEIQVFNTSLIKDINNLPILIIEKQNKIEKQILEVQSHSIIMIVLVHGFQGSHYDMDVWNSILQIRFPFQYILSSRINETHTENDIEKMGERLAQEIMEFINHYQLNTKNLRINMIGHSLGGIIIRSSIKYLPQLKDCFNTLVTLSSPHVGIYSNKNKLTATGLFFMKRLKKCLCLDQLTLSDNNLQDTFIYRLSKQKLDDFQKIILVSCSQDKFVPINSSRIMQIQKEGIHNQMVNNLRKSMGECWQINVNLKIESSDFESFIGKTAHIDLVRNYVLIEMLIDYIQTQL